MYAQDKILLLPLLSVVASNPFLTWKPAAPVAAPKAMAFALAIKASIKEAKGKSRAVGLLQKQKQVCSQCHR